MRHSRNKWSAATLWTLIALASAGGALAFEREDYEEEAGESFAFLLNTWDDVYGMAWSEGVWLKGAPLFGDAFLGLTHNGVEDGCYGMVGMTVRLMPRWRVAPFVGGGGSYNHAFGRDSDPDGSGDDLPSRGSSFWGGHAEAGIRVWIPTRVRLLEIMARYTWSSLAGDRDYWLIGISTGPGI